MLNLSLGLGSLGLGGSSRNVQRPRLETPDFSGGAVHIQDPGPKTPLSEAGYQSWLQNNPWVNQAIQHGLAPLEYLGQSLGKLGRPVKALAGQVSGLDVSPSEYAAFLPFSDALGLTEQKNAVTGEELAKKWNWIDDNSSGLGKFGGGLAADLLTDPLSYLSFGAGGTAKAGIGTAAKAASKVSKPASFLEKIIPSAYKARLLEEATAGSQAGAAPLSKLAGLPGTLTEHGQLLGREGVLQSTNAGRMSGYGSMADSGTKQLLDLAASGKLTGRDAQLLNEVIQGAQSGKAVPLQGLVEANLLPFGTRTLGRALGIDARKVLGTSPTSRALLQPLLGGWGSVPYLQDLWQQSARYAPGIRQIRALMSGEAGGQTSRMGQEFSENLLRPSLKEYQAQGGREITEAKQLLEQAGTPKNPRALDRFMREFGDTGVAPLTNFPQQELQAADQTLAFVKQTNQAKLQQAHQYGIDLGDIKDFLHREATGPGTGVFTGLKKKGPTTTASREFKSPTSIVNEIGSDPLLSGLHPGRISDDQTALNYLMSKWGNRHGFAPPGKEWETGESLLQWAKGLSPEYRKGAQYFGNTVLRDQEGYLAGIQRMLGEANAIHNQLALSAIPQEVLESTGAASRSRNLWQALQDVGYTTDAKRGLTGHEELAQRLSELAGQVIPATEQALSQWHVPDEVIKAIKVGKDNLKDIERAGVVNNLWTIFTNLFKTGNTIFHPAYQLANMLGNVAQNTVSGIFDPNRAGPMKILGPYIDAFRFLKGQAVKDLGNTAAYRGMNAAQATAQATRDVMGFGLGGKTGQHSSELVTRATTAATDASPLPGRVGSVFGAEPWNQGTMGMLGARGVMEPTSAGMRFGAEATQSTNPLVRVLEGTSEIADRFGRLAHYFGRIRQGLDPAGAAASTMAAHYSYTCVDVDTEILTRRGWKRHNQISTQDECLTLNPLTRRIEWQPILKVNQHDFDGELESWKSTRIDALTTPNHRWLAEGVGKQGGHWSVRKTGGTHFFESSQVAGKNYVIIVGGGSPVSEVKIPIYSNQFVELIGWYLTEGGPHGQTKYGLYITQSEKHNPRYVQEIDQIASYYQTRGATVTSSVRVGQWGAIKKWYFGKGIGEVVRQAAPDKQLTSEFLSCLTEEQLIVLYETLMKGDGTVSASNSKSWCQKDELRTDSFQMLCAMIGKRTHRRFNKHNECFFTTPYASSHLYTKGFVPEKQKYKGIVWCPTTENGTWMARRNGVTYWTGNSLSKFEREWMRKLVPFYSWARFNVPFYGEILSTSPGLIHNMMRTEGALDESTGLSSQYLPEFMRGSTAIPVGQAQQQINPDSGRVEVNQKYRTPYRIPGQEALQYLSNASKGLGQIGEAIGARTGDTPPDQPKPEFVNKDAARFFGGQLNPLLKAVAEGLSGHNLYTGGEQELASQAKWWEDPASKSYVALARFSPFARAVATYEREKQNIQKGQLEPWEIAANVALGPMTRSIDINAAQQKELEQSIKDQVMRDPAARTRSEIYAPLEDQNLLMSDPNRLNAFRALENQDQKQQLAGLQYKLEQLAQIKPRLEELRQISQTRPLSRAEQYELDQKGYAEKYEPVWRMQAKELVYKMQTETGVPGLSVGQNPYGKPLQALRVGIRRARGDIR